MRCCCRFFLLRLFAASEALCEEKRHLGWAYKNMEEEEEKERRKLLAERGALLALPELIDARWMTLFDAAALLSPFDLRPHHTRLLLLSRRQHDALDIVYTAPIYSDEDDSIRITFKYLEREGRRRCARGGCCRGKGISRSSDFRRDQLTR